MLADALNRAAFAAAFAGLRAAACNPAAIGLAWTAQIDTDHGSIQEQAPAERPRKETVMGMISVWRLAADEQIEELLSEPAMIEELLDEDGPDIDLDRAWHGLHYLLAGSARETAGPRGYILGGHSIGEVCVGYGPARALTSREVAVFDDLLQCISREDLEKRFSPETLMRAEIYPEIWDRALTGEEDVFAYLVDHFDQLKQFVASAHRDGVGVITYLA
jgi:hypothetical protein